MNGVVYITKKGDTWDSIAYEHYGSEEMIAPIIRANRAHVETVIFNYGVALEIPEIERTGNSANLPPWRKDNAGS